MDSTALGIPQIAELGDLPVSTEFGDELRELQELGSAFGISPEPRLGLNIISMSAAQACSSHWGWGGARAALKEGEGGGTTEC